MLHPPGVCGGAGGAEWRRVDFDLGRASGCAIYLAKSPLRDTEFISE